ncbi:MAG TPA: DUF1553 domain-containing protein, partial [Lacipirellulaceae bacterium]|nr:DUF1553 domain-containing protein [Lacipirellulaceae bacterium]
MARQCAEVDAQIAELEASLSGVIKKDWRKSLAKLVELKQQRVNLEGQFVPAMITQAAPPREVRILPRGNWMDKSGPVVAPRTPSCLPQLPAAGTRGTRLDLARWLVDRGNPLTARVVVNRLWQRFFGAGLTKSLLDMGSQSDYPAHPELLDWLAVEFVDSGWDVKHIVRLIVTSQTYRQASKPRAEVDAVDPENRWLARQAAVRLDAEQIRDNALAVAGLLVMQTGGDISRPYQPARYYEALNFPTREY